MNGPTENSKLPAASGAGLQPDQSRRPLLTRVFRNDTEVRAGWRLLIFLAILTAASPIVGVIARHFVHGSPHGYGPGALAAGDGAGLLAALGAVGVIAMLEHRSFGDYGLPFRQAFRTRFWFGALWGWASVTLLLLLIRMGGGFYFGTLAVHSAKTLLYYAAGWAFAFLVVGWFEEFLFRCYPLYTLSTGIGFWPAAIGLSALFGAVHLANPGEEWKGALAAGLIGLFFCFSLRRTGSLWFAVGFHAAWDYSESFVYSVPDSGIVVHGHLLNSTFRGPAWLTGGRVGPEASAFVFVVVAILLLALHLAYPKARFQPSSERLPAQ